MTNVNPPAPTVGALAELAGLVGDPARANMLLALMDGRAFAAGELARVAGVTPSTASEHLGRLLVAGLVGVTQRGRHRYYRLASTSVAEMIERMMAVVVHNGSRAADRPGRIVVGPRDDALRQARVCYNHLAGRVAVDLAEALRDDGALELSEEGAVLTGEGARRLEKLGADMARARARGAERAEGSLLCRTCVDWSERRLHLGGPVGTAIYDAFLGRGWCRRLAGKRTVEVTPAGVLGLRNAFGVSL